MNWQSEIEDLHQFFEGWMGGALPKTEATYVRVSKTMGAGFHIISPSGEMTARDDLLKGLYEAHNSRENWRIWIKNPTLHHQFGDVLLASYEEWQQFGDKTTARLSSALFQADDSAPHGVLWLHVHETWIDISH